MAKIKIKRGLQVNLPTLETGELALTTDTKKVYVGTSDGNKEIGGGGIVINEWQELTLLNNFTGYIKIRKNALGQVEIMVDITVPDPFVSNAYCVLPVGFRPSFSDLIYCRQSAGGDARIWYSTVSNNLYGGNTSTVSGVEISGHAIFLLNE